MGRRVGSCRVVSVMYRLCYPHIEPIFISSLSLLFSRLEYVKVNNTKHELPTNAMPKFKCLEEDGRADLKRAISKFGGKKNISQKAGLTVT